LGAINLEPQKEKAGFPNIGGKDLSRRLTPIFAFFSPKRRRIMELGG